MCTLTFFGTTFVKKLLLDSTMTRDSKIRKGQRNEQERLGLRTCTKSHLG